MMPFLTKPHYKLTITCKVDSSVITSVPFKHQSTVLWCQQFAHCGPIITEVCHAGLNLRESVAIPFCRLWAKKKDQANMKGREENPGRDPTCLI